MSRIGYDAAHFAAVAAREEKHFWFRSRRALLLWALRRHFPQARSFLDVGCGTGDLVAAIAATRAVALVAGAEGHAEALAFAARREAGALLVQADARALPWREEFDVVGAFDVLEHIDDDAAALAAMHGVCRPGGGIMLTVPQHRWLWSGRDVAARHRRRYSRRELLSKLGAAGFERPWTTSFVALLLPLLYVSRRWGRAARAAQAMELDVAPAANAVLGGVLALERTLIRLGVRWPAGGSLLVVARKP
jgi:SAM-dependent methyltransferase